MSSKLPKSSKIVVIGGGIIGCSTAYHLAHMGLEVVLLERKKLTSGTTFHAAGLVGQLRTNANITQLLCYSVDLYNKLEKELLTKFKQGNQKSNLSSFSNVFNLPPALCCFSMIVTA